MVENWEEVFEVGCKNARLKAADFASDANTMPSEIVAEYVSDCQARAKFFERCAQIYAEEMQEIETVAAQGRERAAARMVKELGGKTAQELAQALRDNTPQNFAMYFDWN